MSNLEVPKIICNQCNGPITSTSFVHCHHCNKKFHYSPCTVLSESSYCGMGIGKKTEWKCHQCKPRAKSPNNIYQSFVFNDSPQSQQKSQREDDNLENENSKRFKNTTTSKTSNNTQTDISQHSDIIEIKSGMVDLKSTIQQVAQSIAMLTTSNNEIKQQLSGAIEKINENIASLNTKVKDLEDRDKAKGNQISELEKRIQRLEQQNINKNTEVAPKTVIKKISASIGVDLNDSDICSAYRIKRNNKIIVEFATVQKKKEIMYKMRGHRIDQNIIREGTNNPTNNSEVNYIYVNDELTPNNRRLLWMTKIKAKECNWKYVWVRNGNIFARKNENSSSIVIISTADIESMTIVN